jgi:hypothetical protein
VNELLRLVLKIVLMLYWFPMHLNFPETPFTCGIYTKPIGFTSLLGHLLPFELITESIPPIYSLLHTNFPLFKAVLQVISWHPVQQVHHFRLYIGERLKMSSFQCTFSLCRTVKAKGPNPVNGEGGGQGLKCAYWLRVASQWRHWDPAHCLGAESRSSFTILAFYFLLFLAASPELPASNFD